MCCYFHLILWTFQFAPHFFNSLVFLQNYILDPVYIHSVPLIFVAEELCGCRSAMVGCFVFPLLCFMYPLGLISLPFLFFPLFPLLLFVSLYVIFLDLGCYFWGGDDYGFLKLFSQHYLLHPPHLYPPIKFRDTFACLLIGIIQFIDFILRVISIWVVK